MKEIEIQIKKAEEFSNNQATDTTTTTTTPPINYKTHLQAIYTKLCRRNLIQSDECNNMTTHEIMLILSISSKLYSTGKNF
ncbi:hypothetical protein Glove_19g173 [Diversispora epigaea]|uniref:Uncharacterized protein n=1 Tax=Diversispora epigaea TaxID=1348612 RepID=A0A397JL89_9GLOM|nr:hypothetical protein Glove_19g173 [Diversispora epigaea]